MSEIYYFLSTEQFQPEVLVEHAKLAEDAGFDGLMISEHFHPWVDELSAASFAFSVLGAIAVSTSRVRLVTGVTTPLFRYHPATVAQAAATIDRLSNGRFALGVGTGEKINEGPLGYDFPSYAERSARMREALEIMRRLLDGEKLDFDGEFYKTEKAKLYSPPVNRVPIYMAAGGPKSASLAGEQADGVITSVKDIPDTLERGIKTAKELAKDEFSIVGTRWSVFANNDDEAWEALQSQRGLRVEGRDEEVDPQVLRERADKMERSEIVSKYLIVKDYDSMAQVYLPLIRDLKADIVVVQTTSVDQKKHIERMGKSLLHKLRKA